MRDVQDRRGWRLVDLAALDANQPILDMVDAAHAMPAAERVQALHQLHRLDGLAVDGDRDATLETDDDLGRDGRSGTRVDGPLVDIGGWRLPRILQDARLDRATPQVVVDR